MVVTELRSILSRLSDTSATNSDDNIELIRNACSLQPYLSNTQNVNLLLEQICTSHRLWRGDLGWNVCQAQYFQLEMAYAGAAVQKIDVGGRQTWRLTADQWVLEHIHSLQSLNQVDPYVKVAVLSGLLLAGGRLQDEKLAEFLCTEFGKALHLAGGVYPKLEFLMVSLIRVHEITPRVAQRLLNASNAPNLLSAIVETLFHLHSPLGSVLLGEAATSLPLSTVLNNVAMLGKSAFLSGADLQSVTLALQV